jgi:dihydropteroate synthase
MSFNLRFLNLNTPERLRLEMEKIGAHPGGMKIMVPKGLFSAVKLEGVKFAAANIIKQEMLSLGGEAVLAGGIYFGEKEASDILLLGTQRHYEGLIKKLRAQPLKSLVAIASELQQGLARYLGERSPLTIGGTTFHWGKRTYIMAILNLTPDSFSGDGLFPDIDKAVARAQEFASQGADIIDVGGESTRPGSEPLPADEELSRVLPTIERLVGKINVSISIDTYKTEVAERALAAGASMVNDVWGLRMDPDMAALVARWQVPVIIMHNRSRPKDAVQTERLGGRYLGVEYRDLMADIIRELRESVGLAVEAGIDRSKIIIDPGIGFGKTVEQNLELLFNLAELKVLGHPILVGPSRKSFIGYTLDLPPEERLEGTAATVALAIAGGADIVRVHDVKEMARVARMTDAVVRRETASKV